MEYGDLILCVKKGKWFWQYTDTATKARLKSRVGVNSPGAALDGCLRELEGFYAIMHCRFAA